MSAQLVFGRRGGVGGYTAGISITEMHKTAGAPTTETMDQVMLEALREVGSWCLHCFHADPSRKWIYALLVSPLAFR